MAVRTSGELDAEIADLRRSDRQRSRRYHLRRCGRLARAKVWRKVWRPILICRLSAGWSGRI